MGKERKDNLCVNAENVLRQVKFAIIFNRNFAGFPFGRGTFYSEEVILLAKKTAAKDALIKKLKAKIKALKKDMITLAKLKVKPTRKAAPKKAAPKTTVKKTTRARKA